jgi:hypothetical protein
MAKLDSEETRRQLTTKLGCKPDPTKDHIFFVLRDTDGTVLGRTKISHGPRHDIPHAIVSLMAKQLRLGSSGNLVGLVNCTKDQQECLTIIRAASY